MTSEAADQGRTPMVRSRFVAIVLAMALAVLWSGASGALAQRKADGAGAASRPAAPVAASRAGSPAKPDAKQGADALDAGPANGSFETGDLTGWTVGGSAGIAEALLGSNFSPVSVPPTQGSYAALVCNGPGGVGPTGQSNLDGDPLNTEDNDRSYIEQSFTLTASEVPATLSFDYSWLTGENPAVNSEFDDFFQITLNGGTVLAGSVAGRTLSPFPNVGTDGAFKQVISAGPTNGCQFDYGRSAYQTSKTIINSPGVYTLRFLVSDQGNADNQIDSGLLVDNVRVEPEIDLAITKTATPNPAVAGESLVYNITVKNNGTGRATNVYVTDTLPAEVVYVSDTQGCTTGALPQMQCFLGDILGGQQKSFQISVKVNANTISNGPPITLTNTATTRAFNNDPNLENNTVVLSTLVNDRADLRLTKISEPHDFVRAGQTFTYTIFVDNWGPSVARGVIVTDTLLSSASVEIQSCAFSVSQGGGSITQFSCTTGSLVSTQFGTDVGTFGTNFLDPLTPSTQGRLRASFRLKALANMDVSNTTRVTALTPDPDTSNNFAIDTISVTSAADVGITKIGADFLDGDLNVLAGRTVIYTVTVNNNGPSTAESITVYDNLPPGLVKNSVLANISTSTGGGGICTNGTPGNPADPMICQIGDLPVGATATIRVVADVDPNFLVKTATTQFSDFLSNDAWVTLDGFDLNTLNNRAVDAFVQVQGQADLVVTKSALPSNPVAGQVLSYQIEVTNRGPSTAEDVFITDLLPPGVTFVSAESVNDGPEATCVNQAGGNQITCNLGDIEPFDPALGAPRRFVFITVQVDPNLTTRVLTNTVTGLSLATADITPTNNTNITRAVTVNNTANVTITKVASTAAPVAGQDFHYTITVLNTGPSTAHNVVVTDVLPANVTYLYDTGNCGQQALSTGCSFGDLAPRVGRDGGTLTFDIYVRVNPDANCDGMVTNTARVGWQDGVNLVTVNRTAAATSTLPIDCIADLRVRKFGKPDEHVRAGEFLTYTVVIDNLGPSYAPTATLKDILQSDGVFTMVSLTSDRPATCFFTPPGPPPITNINQRLLTDCLLNSPLDILAGSPSPVNPGRWIITMTVTAAQEQSMNNLASVLSSATDPTPADNQAEVEHAIGDVSDLAVTKQDFPDPVIAGQTLTYTIRITNNGPSDAHNTLLYDRLPAGIVVTSVSTSNGATCSTGTPGSVADRLTCGLDTLRSTGPVTTAVVTVVATVKPDVPLGTILENDVYVTSENYEPNNANNFAHSLTLVNTSADLFINKFGNPANIRAGEITSYDIVFGNNGPSVARNVRIQDVLPAGFDILSVQVFDGPGTTGLNECQLRFGDPALVNSFTCELGDLQPGQNGTLVVKVFVRSNTAAGAYVNIVNISSQSPNATPDPNGGNNNATFTTNVVAAADLLVEKTSDPVMVYAGETKRYTIKVTNLGPSDAVNVIVTDTLPAQARYAVDTGLCTNNAGVVTCNLGTMVVGAMKSFDILTVIDPATLQDLTIRPFGLTITNTAVVASNTPDPATANNTAFRRNFVQEKSDLKITKFGKRDGSVRAGDVLTYTVIVDNLGPSYAYSVTVKDLLQSSGIFDVIDVNSDRPATCRSLPAGGASYPLAATAWPIVNAPPPFGVLAPSGQANVNQRYELDCILNNPLAVVSPQGGPQNPGRWILTVRVRAQQPQDIDNVAFTQSDVALDPDFSNNQAYVLHEITAVADLQVTKSDNPDPVVAGTPLTYTIRITNNGPSDAENVVMIDRLPPGIVLTGITTSNGATCTTGAAGNPLDRLQCDLGYLRSLAPFNTIVITVSTRVNANVPQGTILENDVYVSSDVFDNNNGNNFAHQLTTVGTLSNLRITKLDFPDPVVAGTNLEYRIRIENFGPSVASNVRISDTLPNAAFVSFLGYNIGNGGGICFYQSNTNEIDCNLGDIAVGSYREVFIKLFVSASTPDGTSLLNTVNVLADSTIAFTPDSDFTETTTVIARADLKAEKSSSPVVVYAGEEKRYTITITNLGPSDSQNVRVTDTLPAQAFYEVNTGLCQQAAQVVTCNFGTMPVGSSRSFVIYTEIDPATVMDLTLNPEGRTITNTVTVNATTVDPIPANNTARSENFVREKADLQVTKFGKRDGKVRAGDVLTYTVIVDNLGPSWAYSVTLKDVLQSSGAYELIDIISDRAATCRRLPPGGAALSLPAIPWPPVGVPLPPFGVNAPTGVANINQRLEVDCVLDNPLAVISPVGGPQNPGRWIITMRIRAPQEQDVNNVAFVQSDVALDPNFDNNEARVEHEITAVADLMVKKTAAGENTTAGCPPGTAILADSVTAGRLLTYTVTIVDNGYSDAENVIFSDRLPPGVVLVSVPTIVSPPSATIGCETGTPGNPLDQLVCGVSVPSGPGDTNLQPRIRAGQMVVFRYAVRVNPSLAFGSILENDVSVTSRTFDNDLSNNFHTNLTTVNTAADLVITKTDAPDPVIAGKKLQYTVTITNNGPSDALNVTVTDTLPAEVIFDQAMGAACKVDVINPRLVNCQLGTLPPGVVATFMIIVNVKPDAVPSGLATTLITNNITVGTTTFDPCAANNTTSQSTTVNRMDDAFIMKTDDPDPVIAGTTISYTIMFGNLGMSTSTSVVVTDTLPLGMTLNRCDPIDPNDFVTCTVTGGNGQTTPQQVQLITLRKKNNVIWSSTFGNALNDLDPGEIYSFKLVANVASGYVLDGRSDAGPGQACAAYLAATGWAQFAVNTARITTLTDAAFAGDNFDQECTRVDALADLEIKSQLGLSVPLNFPPYLALALRQPVAATGPAETVHWVDRPELKGAPAAAGSVPAAANGGPTGSASSASAPAPTDLSLTSLLQSPSAQCATCTGTQGIDQAAPQLVMCDAVQPGGMQTIDLIVRNLGPSDAAQAFVEVFLPEDAIAVDPDQVTVTVSRGQLVEKRDDGRLTIIVGNDPTSPTPAQPNPVNQLGRINAGSQPITITLGLMIRKSAKCGSRPVIRANVGTRRNDILWPLQFGATVPRTPTPDPNLANNTTMIDFLIVCPALTVKKSVSFDGTCPGARPTVVTVPGQPVTFCFEITNSGDTYLDFVRITDTLTTRIGPRIVFTDLIRSGMDPKVPLPPGETVTRTVTLPPFCCEECGQATDRLDGSGIATNSGRTVYRCVPPVRATDVVTLNIACAGLDYRLALPVLNSPGCQSWVSVQNVGMTETKALFVVWGEAGACPPQSAGPLKIECSGLLKPGSTWTFAGSQLPAGARSALVYSVNAKNKVRNPQGNLQLFADLACNGLFGAIVGSHDQWYQFDEAFRTRTVYNGPFDSSGLHQLVLDFNQNRGEPLAVMVDRSCPDAGDPNVKSSASYIGIASDAQGSRDTVYGGHTYYTPLVFASKSGLNSWLYIQNVGNECSSLELWFKAQDNCLRPVLGDVLQLAPGETVHFDPNTVVGPDWLGSAWIRSSQPLAIVVDTMGANHFTSYAGIPGDITNDPLHFFSIGSQVNYAPLIYSEYQGWDTAIQVQNLSAVVPAKVKVYFLDRSGDIITTLVDWICPRGSQTFFLPLVANLPGNWVGSARVESQEWVTPGSPAVDPPRVQSVVMLERWADVQRTQRREAAAYNAATECTTFDWQLGAYQGGTQSGSAVIGLPLLAKSNRGVTSEVAITNVVPKPGKTDFVVYIYDQNGLLDYICEVLNQKQVEYLDVNTYGWIPPNFLGSAVISAVFWEHDVFAGNGGFVRNIVGLSAVNVERIGGVLGGPDVPGDESKASEGIPLFNYFMPMGPPPSCPGVPPMSFPPTPTPAIIPTATPSF